MRLVYSRDALDEVTCLRRFIAQHDPHAAKRVGEALVARIERLRHFPQMGTSLEQAPPPADIRDMVFGNYVVRYSVHANAIAILRIWHRYENRHPLVPDAPNRDLQDW